MSEIKEMYDATSIRERISQLALAIRADAGDREVLLIAVLKGSAVFLADLLRAIEGEVSYEFIDVVRESETDVGDAISIDFMTHFSIEGRAVYVLKDVVSTGIIENYLLTQLQARKPERVKLVALLDRPDQRHVSLDVDFTAFVAAEGMFVGYGLEQNRKHGNLTGIGVLVR